MTAPRDRLYRICIECGADFWVSARAQEVFLTKRLRESPELHLELPRRCFECRLAKRERNARQAHQSNSERVTTWE